MNALPIPLPRLLRRGSPARIRQGLGFALALLVLLLCAPALQAQETETADPPARVGSISALRGPVDFSAQSGAAWDAARLNQPVTGQSALWAPPGSQAEVRIGSTSVRLDGNTQAVFSQLDDHGVAIDLAQGSVRARLRSLPTGDAFSLAADGVRADAQMPGDYRADYDPDRRLLTVRAISGRLRVVTPTGGVDLQSGQEAQVAAGGTDLQLRAMGPRDEFDRWAEARDGEQDRLTALRYVSPEMTGVESLDAHGRWEVTDDYGPIWYPSALAAGWAPYRYGHWAWVAPWGWTWIDDAPWGFAPFHYGRWARVGSRWGWVPGPIVARPVWAPALVGYVGGQPSGLSISIGIGAPVGWFPLGPYETFQPCYRHSAGYVRLVNDPHWRHRDRDRRWHGGRDKDDRDHRWRDRDGRGGDWKDRDGKDHDDRDRHGRDRDGRDRDRDDDRRMTRQPVPDYRYARLAEAVTVARADDFRNSRPIGRQRIALDPRQAAQLSPVMARLQEGGADGPDARTPRQRDTRDGAARDGVTPAPVATLPPPPPRAARERNERERDERGRAALRESRPGGAAPEVRGRRDADEAPRATLPTDRRVPPADRDARQAGGARSSGDARDGREARGHPDADVERDARDARDAGERRGAAGIPREGDSRDSRDSRDAREAAQVRDPRDGRDGREARDPGDPRDAPDPRAARDAGGAAAPAARNAGEAATGRDGRDADRGPSAAGSRDARERPDPGSAGRPEPTPGMRPAAPPAVLIPAPSPRDDRPSAGAPRGGQPADRPTARPDDRPRAVPPAPERAATPVERRDAPRAGPDTAPGRSPAAAPRVERPERPAAPAPRERDATRGAPERRGAVAAEPVGVPARPPVAAGPEPRSMRPVAPSAVHRAGAANASHALRGTPPVPMARPAPAPRAQEAPRVLRAEPMESRRQAGPSVEGGRGRSARQER